VLVLGIDAVVPLIGFQVWVGYGADEANNGFLLGGRPVGEVE